MRVKMGEVGGCGLEVRRRGRSRYGEMRKVELHLDRSDERKSVVVTSDRVNRYSTLSTSSSPHGIHRFEGLQFIIGSEATLLL